MWVLRPPWYMNFDNYYYIAYKYTIQEVFIIMADYVPNYSTAGGYVAGQVDSTNGGYDPTAGQSQLYTGAPDYTVVGGYDPNAIGSTGGGYDPSAAYMDPTNSIGGDVAVSQNYSGAPNFNPSAAGAGGYDPTTMGDNIYTGGGFDPTVAGLSDPINARLSTAGLNPGGGITDAIPNPSVAFQTVNGPAGAAQPADTDWRVRISLADNAQIFYKNAGSSSTQNQLMQPLGETNGVIFPYTPSISITHAANYSPVNPTHSNYPMQFYNNSEVSDINISGEFTVQSITEGRYLMAAVYFFRSCTKMFFGSGANAGNPPPIIFLDGYGSHYFPHVPCVISAFTHTLDKDVDYIEIPLTSTTLQTVSTPNAVPSQLTSAQSQFIPSMLQSSSTNTQTSSYQNITSKTRVPTTSTISITLKPIYSRKNLHNRFDLNKFAAGQLLRDSNNGFGGFL